MERVNLLEGTITKAIKVLCEYNAMEFVPAVLVQELNEVINQLLADNEALKVEVARLNGTYSEVQTTVLVEGQNSEPIEACDVPDSPAMEEEAPSVVPIVDPELKEEKPPYSCAV
jgi:hypothetical protein